MNKHIQLIIVAIVAVLIGIRIGMVRADAPGPTTAQTASSTSTMDMPMVMNGMMTGLSGKTGDEFDRAFLQEMTVHHQGAIEMAKAALKQSSREEVKTLAEAIIVAQTEEMQQMFAWQERWFGGR